MFTDPLVVGTLEIGVWDVRPNTSLNHLTHAFVVSSLGGTQLHPLVGCHAGGDLHSSVDDLIRLFALGYSYGWASLSSQITAPDT